MSSMIPTFYALDEVVVTFRPIELCCPNCGRAAGHVYADHPVTVPGVVLGPLPDHKPALCRACGHRWIIPTEGWYYVATPRGIAYAPYTCLRRETTPASERWRDEWYRRFGARFHTDGRPITDHD